MFSDAPPPKPPEPEKASMSAHVGERDTIAAQWVNIDLHVQTSQPTGSGEANRLLEPTAMVVEVNKKKADWRRRGFILFHLAVFGALPLVYFPYLFKFLSLKGSTPLAQTFGTLILAALFCWYLSCKTYDVH